jgi:hypothetical protein
MTIRADEQRGRETAGVIRFWRAVGELPVDRERALTELEGCFSGGAVPEGMDGPYRGRLLATTVGRGLDAVFGGLARAWMPWKGKTLDAGEATGRNIFTRGSRPLIRAIWPRYRDLEPDTPGRYTTFKFVTHTGPSKLMPGLDVLRIDYDIPEDPSFLIRRILDEVVMVGGGLYLGQALMKVRGDWKRAGWFSLEG